MRLRNIGIIWWIKNGRIFSKEYKRELFREKFWGYMMERLPKIYNWCDKHLKCDTLPF